MKRIILLIVILVGFVCLGGQSEKTTVVGEFQIAAREVNAFLLSQEAITCDCCPPLWNGGIATITDKLTETEINDVACIRWLGGYRLYAECIEIVPCVLINNQLGYVSKFETIA